MRTARWKVKYSPILNPKIQKHEFSGRKMPPKGVIGFLRAAICGFDLRLNPTLLRPLWYLPAPRIASLLDNKNCWSILLKNISENNHTAIEGKTQFCQVGQETRGNKCKISIRSDQIKRFTLASHSLLLHPEVVFGSRNGSTMQKKYILLLLERLKC